MFLLWVVVVEEAPADVRSVGSGGSVGCPGVVVVVRSGGNVLTGPLVVVVDGVVVKVVHGVRLLVVGVGAVVGVVVIGFVGGAGSPVQNKLLC